MSRVKPVIKREFTEMVATRGFMIGTVLGPLADDQPVRGPVLHCGE